MQLSSWFARCLISLNRLLVVDRLKGGYCHRSLALLAALYLITWPAWALDLNTASSEALQSLRGVGPRMAERILLERERSPFVSLEDLASRVRGVGPATLDKLRSQGLTVGESRHRPVSSSIPERPQSRLGPGIVTP